MAQARLKTPQDPSKGSRYSSIENLTVEVLSHGKDMSSKIFAETFALLDESRSVISDHSLVAVDELLVSIVDQVEVKLREKIAAQLASYERIPEKLINFLVNDNAMVARHLLTKCEALSDTLLIEVAVNKTEYHRLAIANRTDLSPRLCKTLVSKNEDKVQLTLVRNLGAGLDEEVIGMLLEASRSNPSLCEGLLCRPELSAEHAHEMFWWVSSALRTYILKNYDIDIEVIDRAVGEATHNALIDERPSPYALIMDRNNGYDPSKVEEFTNLFRTLDGDALCEKLSAILGVREETAQRILNDKSGEALAVCCKALNAYRQQFVRTFLVIDYSWFGEVRSTGHIERITRVFDSLSMEQARRTINYWDLRQQTAA